jgi:MraZ protein
LVFTGTYEHTIDAKNRLAIPAEIRQQLQEQSVRSPDEPIYLYVTAGEGESLCLYTEKEFDRRAEQLNDSDRSPDEILAYETLFYSFSRRVELDKNGRVRLPENILAFARIESEIVLLGVKDHLQIRNRKTWQDYIKKALASDSQRLVNPRRVMKRPQQ